MKTINYHYPFYYLVDSEKTIRVEKLDLHTLKHLKVVFDFYSDFSSQSLGYRFICQMINDMETYKQKPIILKIKDLINAIKP